MGKTIIFNGKTVDLQTLTDLSEEYDKKRGMCNTEYITIIAAVLGNAAGKETVEGDDNSTALAAIHGRKYNSLKASFPFSKEYIDKNYAKFDNICQTIANKMTSISAELQKTLTPEQVKAGKEVAMRTQAIREAKAILQTNGAAIDEAEFAKANQSVRAEVGSKVYAHFGGNVSARAEIPKDGKKLRSNYKRKNISVGDANYNAATAIAEMAGLKKVPIFTTESKAKAEENVFTIANLVAEEVKKIPCLTGDEWSDDDVFTALQTVVNKLPGDGKTTYNVPEYTEEERNQIAAWTREIVDAYQSI